MDAPVAQPPGTAPAFQSGANVEQFQFSGSGAEYFRIWIVNLLLTIVTLGIYSAWAKVRRLRYFYGSTTLAGSSFEYHGQPIQILKGRLIAVAILIPYFLIGYFLPPWDLVFVPIFLIALPFLVVKSRLFTSRMTSWRNIHFDFVGTYGRAAGVYLGLMLLTVVTLGLLFPYWTYARQRFLIGNMRLGTTPFHFRAGAVDYYVAVVLGALIIFGGVALSMVAIFAFLGTAQQPPQSAAFGYGYFVMMPVMVLSYVLGFAFIQARITNIAFSNTSIGPHKLECKLKTWPLFWLYVSSALAAALSLGLLIPWVHVRLTRYQLENMSVHVVGDLDQFVGIQQSQVAATGQEVGDLLDVDFGL